ncbi:phage tail spike protein [Weissella cibaria]|uniref:phage tail spike protein n=1 Tax=Weissella cibaria TaxID=137591 RepID=UPI0016445077|nr:phage tail spike protein [Weissella cibaria]
MSNKGRGANDFWGDTISQQIADTQDILGNVDLTVDNVSRNIDVSGNTKNWNHTLSGISFNNTPVGAQVENGYYLLYKDDATNRHYLMQLTSVLEKVTPGGQHYKTATGVNAALYDFSRMIVDAKEFYSAPTGTQTLGSLQNILKYLLGHAGWNVNLEDYNFPDVQYSISDNTSVQSVLQDIIKLFDVDVDAYVTLTPQGRLAKRVVEFRRTMGTDSGVTIRYGKNMTDMTREALSDSIYTKLYVQGANGLKISSVNNGLPYIVDEAANKRYNPVGASSSPETFREGTVINSMIIDAWSLLAWGKKQLQALNHPRINYTISSIASTEAGLGDTIRVQDLYASQQILLTSRVIQKTFSFANPTTNTLVLGEYSSVIGDKTKNVDLIAKLGQVADDITVVSEAAVKTQVIAESVASIASQASSAASSAATHANATEVALSSAFNTAKSDVARLYSENKADTASLNSWVTEQLATTNKMVEDAKASAIEIGQTTAQNAQNELSSAKNSLSSEIASQATAYTSSATAIEERAQSALNAAKSSLSSAITIQATATSSLVSAVDSNASKYATQAKSEAVAAAQTADGVVRSDFKKTTDSISTTITQNKSEADSKIQTAQTTATQALDGLATKVSQTEYNTKTGQIQTDLTATTQTANQAKTDIVSIKQKDGEQDEKMNSIESDVDGTKQTVSDLQTVQGKQSGDISTLQQRADGFEATVNKVNNLSVGGRNILLNSKILSWGVGTNAATTSTKVSYDNNTNMWHITSPKGGSGNAGIYFSQTNNVSNIITNGKQWAFSFDIKGTGVYSQFGIEGSSPFNKLSGNVPTDWARVSSTGTASGTDAKPVIIYFNSINVALDVYIKLPKLEYGNLATDWTPAPEDLSSATSKAQLTADQAKLSINNYKTDADGRISKAQADIKVNADAITQKVSQSDYNAKTGELTTSVNKAQQTADTATQTIGSYKETNDKRVTAAETNIKANADAISLTASKTELNSATGALKSDISTLQQRADGFEATVTKVNNLAVGGRNLLLGTANWTDSTRWNQRNSVTTDTYRGMVIASTSSAWISPIYLIQNAGILQVGKTYTFSTYVRNTSDTDVVVTPYYDYYVVSGGTNVSLPAHTDWTRAYVIFNIKKDPTTSTSGLRWESHNSVTNGSIQFAGYKLEEGNVATDWSPAPEDVSSATAKAQLTADNATLSINNYKTDADQRISKAQADIKVNADAITQKVSQSDYNAKTGELTTSVSKAQQTADTATQTIGTYKEYNDKRVAAAETNITANADAIKLTASKTELNQATGKLSGDISTLQQRADGFDATVTKVNNLAVGGRNLLTNTNKDVSITSHTTDGWPAWANIDTGFSFENGKTYTFSAEAKNSTDKIAEASIRVFEASTNTQVGIYVFPADGKRHSVNFTIPNDSHNYHLLFYAGHAGIAPGVDLTTTYHHPKLEAGNIATDWTPAPEDVDSNIAQVKLTADGLYEKVNNPTTGIATRLLTAEGTITTVQDKTNELTSKLTQTTSAIQASVATKTDKSTVLQLFSDNFEAGIKANTGALIAGINADTSGTTIAGKHITLDGSVTVTGAFVSKALSTADATITKVLTIGSGGSIVNTYTKSGTFTGYSGQVSYSLSGKFTFNNSGISFGGTAKGPNVPTSTSGEVSQRGIPFVPTQWNASSVVNEALMQMSATAVKGYSVKSDVLASGDSSYLNLSAFNIQLNSGGYDTYIGPDMIMTDGQVQASAFTARGTSYFKNIEAGVVDSGPIRLNNAHTIFTTDGTTLYLAGGAQGGGAGVQVTDNFTVKGDMSVGTVNAGGNINVGWDVIKNGTGLHPDYFNNTLPGIHIMGTNSGIAWDIKNKLAYIIIENSYKGLGNNNTGTGKWKN